MLEWGFHAGDGPSDSHYAAKAQLEFATLFMAPTPSHECLIGLSNSAEND